VTLAAADVARIFPGTPFVGDRSLSATFHAGKDWEVEAVGTIAGAAASIDARATTAPLAGSVHVHLDGIDPSAAWAAAPRGHAPTCCG